MVMMVPRWRGLGRGTGSSKPTLATRTSPSRRTEPGRRRCVCFVSGGAVQTVPFRDFQADERMFEFGRDLKRVFSRAKERREEVWLELIGADLLEAEARQQSIEAGRVSCAEPVEANLRAAVLWREHARRTGKR